uniref:PsiF repeat-containing protein n=1 Tax=mine drainage metagenome TaxID=410659 RepID=E6PWJ2_9ZZZZ
MQSATLIRSQWIQTLAAAALLASLGAVPAHAQTAGAPPAGSAAQGHAGAPSKATCEQEAKAQGLGGNQAKTFVEQCMRGG